MFEPTNSRERGWKGKLRYAMVLDRTSLKRCHMIFDNGGHLQKTRGGLDEAVGDEPFELKIKL